MKSILQKLFPTTIDHDTWASNPGCLPISYWTYFRSFPQEARHHFSDLFWWLVFWPTINLAYWIGGAFFVEQVSKNYSAQYADLGVYLLLLYIFSGLAINAAFFRGLTSIFRTIANWLMRLREHFNYGCVNPAIVVSQSPPLVAVSTDLCKWEEPYPVIKILSQPLDKLPGGAPPIGTRLATVALYCEGVDAELDHWVDFNPIVANCVTDNQADLDRLFDSIPRQDWQDLETGLGKVKRRSQAGLYFVNTLDRYVLPVAADKPEDFIPIEQLDLLDVRDVLRIDYQTGTVLQLHRGFSSAKASWTYEWDEFWHSLKHQSAKTGLGGMVIALLTLLGLLGRVLRPLVYAYRGTDQPDKATWLIYGLISVSIIAIPVVYSIVYLFMAPFRQVWKFDRTAETLTVTSKSLLRSNHTRVYPLGQFHNIDILDKDKVASGVDYCLILQEVQKRGFLFFKPKTKSLRLTKIAHSDHPELNQRFHLAQQVRFAVRQFMDWPMV